MRQLVGRVCLWALFALCLWQLAANRAVGEGGEEQYTSSMPYEIYILIGDLPVWMGDEIRYTVTKTVPVEARIMSPTGEIIVLLQLGDQAPGQYTLPWHGAAMGAPMAGTYTFELYYGDEYAAKLPLIVAPLRSPSGT